VFGGIEGWEQVSVFSRAINGEVWLEQNLAR
jgi:hypothetical protein